MGRAEELLLNCVSLWRQFLEGETGESLFLLPLLRTSLLLQFTASTAVFGGRKTTTTRSAQPLKWGDVLDGGVFF